LGINCIINISLVLKVYRNVDKDGMDGESPFHENWMSSGMSMGWDWWNRWIQEGSSIMI